MKPSDRRAMLRDALWGIVVAIMLLAFLFII